MLTYYGMKDSIRIIIHVKNSFDRRMISKI